MPKLVHGDGGDWLRPNTFPSQGTESFPLPECVAAEGSAIERRACDHWEGKYVSAKEKLWCHALAQKRGRNRRTGRASLQSQVSLSGFRPGIVTWVFMCLAAKCPPFSESMCRNWVSVTCKPKNPTQDNRIKKGI